MFDLSCYIQTLIGCLKWCVWFWPRNNFVKVGKVKISQSSSSMVSLDKSMQVQKLSRFHCFCPICTFSYIVPHMLQVQLSFLYLHRKVQCYAVQDSIFLELCFFPSLTLCCFLFTLPRWLHLILTVGTSCLKYVLKFL